MDPFSGERHAGGGLLHGFDCGPIYLVAVRDPSLKLDRIADSDPHGEASKAR